MVRQVQAVVVGILLKALRLLPPHGKKGHFTASPSPAFSWKRAVTSPHILEGVVNSILGQLQRRCSCSHIPGAAGGPATRGRQ